MKTKWYFGLMVILILGIGLIASAPAAGAAQRFESPQSKVGVQSNGGLQVKALHSGASNVPVNVVIYDQNWQAIAAADLAGGVHTFSGLRVGDYHVVAESDDTQVSLAQDVPVFARQTTQVDLQLARPQAPAAAAAASAQVVGRCASSGGDGSLIKVYPSFGTTIIYMQCGRVVGKILPSGCGCSSGNWRYTTDCKKSAPIYINLPCPRK